MYRFGVALLGVGIVTIGWTTASNPDEARQRAAAANDEAAVLAEEGYGEEAEKLHQQARELLAAAERERHEDADERERHKKADERERHRERDREHRVAHLDREIKEVHRHLEGLLDQAARLAESEDAEEREHVQKELEDTVRHLIELEIHQRREVHRNERGHELAEHPHLAEFQGQIRQIEHLQRASENLTQAGLHDIAEDLHRRAEEIEQELRRAHEHREREAGQHHPRERERREREVGQHHPRGHERPEREARHQHPREHGEPPLHEVQRAIQQLHEEVRALRAQVQEVHEMLGGGRRSDLHERMRDRNVGGERRNPYAREHIRDRQVRERRRDGDELREERREREVWERRREHEARERRRGGDELRCAARLLCERNRRCESQWRAVLVAPEGNDDEGLRSDHVRPCGCGLLP